MPTHEQRDVDRILERPATKREVLVALKQMRGLVEMLSLRVEYLERQVRHFTSNEVS